MELTGQQWIDGEWAAAGGARFSAADPARGVTLTPPFHEATTAEVERALAAATTAFARYQALESAQRAALLEAIADELMALGDGLIERAQAETGLPPQRLVGERGRTAGQLKIFAELVREGSWVEASIDRAIPDRQPLPKPDVRRMLVPIGPVVVFGASNFPLAFSVAGGDTASGLAAGNPVVVKAHPAHPGTSELAARAIAAAVKKTGVPAGVFSMLQGAGTEVGLALVQHPLTCAVGFTGSLLGGRALFDAAARRPRPIPVYAEMGSTNPVFVLPGALTERGAEIARGLHQSVTLGVGQFCTCPGLVFALEGDGFGEFKRTLEELFRQAACGTMLHRGILQRYAEELAAAAAVPGVEVVRSQCVPHADQTETKVALLSTDAATFLAHDRLGQEIFGPATLLVDVLSDAALDQVVARLDGQLTATIHGTADDLARFEPLLRRIAEKVGRLIFNGYPTGVEVCPSMHHGGPYPATTDVRSTSVGTQAIKRFARPICFQNCPQPQLPAELRDDNPRNIWRLVDGQWGKN